MPRLDGTGPMGMGPRTGIGRGNCPDESNFYGYGIGFCNPLSDDIEVLKAQKVLLEKRLAEINQKIKELS